MKKNISRNPLWPDWYNGKKIDEVQFGRAFLEQWPLKCVNGTLYTLDGFFRILGCLQAVYFQGITYLVINKCDNLRRF